MADTPGEPPRNRRMSRDKFTTPGASSVKFQSAAPESSPRLRKGASSAGMSTPRRAARAAASGARAASRFAIIGVIVFLGLAFVGLIVQFFKRSMSSETVRELVPRKFLEVTPTGDVGTMSLAFEATVTAVKLWGRVLLAVAIPTTEYSLVYAEEGFSALKPSVVLAASWFVHETSIQFKLTLLGLIAATLSILYLDRELKRRQVFERVSKSYRAGSNRVRTAYRDFLHQVRVKSQFAAALVPHVFFWCLALLSIYVFVGQGSSLQALTRGFGAWVFVIGTPVLLSSWSLLAYDSVARKRTPLESSDEDNDDEEEDDQGDSPVATPRGVPPATPVQPNSSQALPFGLVDVQNKLTNAILRFRSRIAPEDIAYVETASPSATNRRTASLGRFLVLPVPYDDEDDAEDAEEMKAVKAPVNLWLEYWCVLSVSLLLEQLPITGHVLSMTPFWPELRLAYAMWLWLPLTRGANLSFRLVTVPLLNRYFRVIEQAPVSARDAEARASGLMEVLVMGGVLSRGTQNMLRNLVSTSGPTLLFSLPFFIMPSFVAKVGILIVSLVFPAHASATALLRDAEQTHWIEYWVVYAVFSVLHAPLGIVFGWWFPFWDQMHLACILWLQLSYFSGAHYVFKVVVVAYRTLRHWRRDQNRRRRRSSIQLQGVPQELLGEGAALPSFQTPAGPRKDAYPSQRVAGGEDGASEPTSTPAVAEDVQDEDLKHEQTGSLSRPSREGVLGSSYENISEASSVESDRRRATSEGDTVVVELPSDHGDDSPPVAVSLPTDEVTASLDSLESPGEKNSE